MKRTPWTTTVVILLGTLWLLSGIAWADPIGPANVPQILDFLSFRQAPEPNLPMTESRTFLTSEIFATFATYYDPNPACVGAPPALVQVLFFNLEGQLILTCTANSLPTCVTQSSQGGGAGSKYRDIAGFVNAGALPAGAYDPYVLVRECTNVNIFVLKGHTIRVLNP